MKDRRRTYSSPDAMIGEMGTVFTTRYEGDMPGLSIYEGLDEIAFIPKSEFVQSDSSLDSIYSIGTDMNHNIYVETRSTVSNANSTANYQRIYKLNWNGSTISNSQLVHQCNYSSGDDSGIACNKYEVRYGGYKDGSAYSNIYGNEDPFEGLASPGAGDHQAYLDKYIIYGTNGTSKKLYIYDSSTNSVKTCNITSNSSPISASNYKLTKLGDGYNDRILLVHLEASTLNCHLLEYKGDPSTLSNGGNIVFDYHLVSLGTNYDHWPYVSMYGSGNMHHSISLYDEYMYLFYLTKGYDYRLLRIKNDYTDVNYFQFSDFNVDSVNLGSKVLTDGYSLFISVTSETSSTTDGCKILLNDLTTGMVQSDFTSSNLSEIIHVPVWRYPGYQ